MAAQTDDVVARLVDRVDGRYFGKYRGVVSANDDPLKLGRVRATVARLFGTGKTGWALPAFAFAGPKQGFYAIPEVGAGVWIEFEEGDLSYPIWTGCWFGSDQLPDKAVPAAKVLRTAGGHTIVLDDAGKSLTITDANGNAIAMDGSQIAITAGKATKVVVTAPAVELAGNAHPIAFGDEVVKYLTQLVQMFQTHMHPGQTAGPFPVTPSAPAPPLPPVPPTISSMKVKAG